MSIVISLDYIICAVIFIIALVGLLYILGRKNFTFSWKAIYTLIGIVFTGFLLYMGNYAVHQAFDSHPVRIETSNNAPADKLVSVESYKATYDLFSSQFSQLLTFLGFFGTIFGLVIPAGAYLLQRQSIKDERERYQHDVEKIKEEFKQKISNFEKYLKKAEEKISSLNNLQNTLLFTSQMNFRAIAGLAIFLINNTKVQTERINLLKYILISFDHAVNCVFRSNNKSDLVKLISTMEGQISHLSTAYLDEFKEAIAGIAQNAVNDGRFVSGLDVQRLLGDENKVLYEWYKNLYKQMYPWKFNGTQKKD